MSTNELTEENEERLEAYRQSLLLKQSRQECNHNLINKTSNETGSWGEFTTWRYQKCIVCGYETEWKCGRYGL